MNGVMMMNSMRNLSSLAVALVMAALPFAPLAAQDAEEQSETSQSTVPGIEVLVGEEMPDTGSDEDLGRVEATVDEIDALIALPAGARLREADEDLTNPADAIRERGVENLLGAAPRFVYVPQGISPMIIPWVREQVILEEFEMEVAKLRATGTPENLQKALETVRRINAQYGTNPNAAWAREAEPMLLAQLRGPEDATNQEQPIEVVQGPRSEEVILPAWIRENTKGVMYDKENPGRSMVLVGRDLLNPGQRVPRYSQVVIKEIGQSQVDNRVEDGYVVFEFRSRDFRVPVREVR
jgi:hypothetical protein